MNLPELLASALLLLSGLAVVRSRNAVHAALALIGNFLVLAGVYVGLDARFVAMTQIIVYAGAIVVLFLFVIMLLQAAQADVGVNPLPGLAPWALLGALILAGGLIAALAHFSPPAHPAPLHGGLPQALGPLLYGAGDWLYVTLLIGFLLLVATVVAVVLVEPHRPPKPAEPSREEALR
jgi:NADH-quinone oxidoreductase subunit J